MAKKDNGIQEWINYCWEMMNNNPYVLPEGEVSHDFDKDLERAVKHKIYHTALYEYKCKLDRMMRNEEMNSGSNEYYVNAVARIEMTIRADSEDELEAKAYQAVIDIRNDKNSQIDDISEIEFITVDKAD